MSIARRPSPATPALLTVALALCLALTGGECAARSASAGSAKNANTASAAQALSPTRPPAQAPPGDSALIRSLYDHALTASSTYSWLRELCKDIGPRLSGSAGAEKAVYWAQERLRQLGCDTVWLQPVTVPHWERGPLERATLHLPGAPDEVLAVCALGGSVGTAGGVLRAPVVEVFRLEDLERMGREQLEGRIVFFNRPMEPRLINTFEAYSGCVDQRSAGAREASAYGALAVLVRSMNLRMDDLPHTGTMSYGDAADSIPAAAISTLAAQRLSRALREQPDLEVSLQLSCRNFPDALSYNVIGELRGAEKPHEYLLVGGHLDSWDLAEGAHDDGAGCVQSMAVLESLVQLGIKPRRSVRCVLFMNEENGARGAAEYARRAARHGEYHLVAIESDRGGFSPRGFSVDGVEGVRRLALNRLQSWLPLLAPYGLHFADYGFSGVDIAPLREQGGALLGLVPDSQRYFDHHHADNDRLEAVNKRELELGAASMAALIYLLDRYELDAAGDPPPPR
jgi:hypothetical protein